MHTLTTENTSLISSEITSQSVPQCWCCWESKETHSNPMIRACQGCKDPDLQFIHQDCINQYIENLPEHMDKTQLNCTRCSDPYFVESIPISPFTIILNDKVLLGALLCKTIAILFFSFTTMSIILNPQSSTIKLILFNTFEISMNQFSLAMFIVCHVFNIITWKAVLDGCRGQYKYVARSINHV